ncbi:MAG: hypothetical protein ACI832_000706, partial [Rheinheimera aquimaris]
MNFYLQRQDSARYQLTEVLPMSTILHIDSSVRAITNPNPNHNSISKNIALR